MGELVGYARTSTLEQKAGFEAQKRDLEAAGCTKIYAEQVSSVAERTQLGAMIDYVRDGDTVIVTKIDRLARSMRDLLDIVGRLRAKGAAIKLPGIGVINGDDPTSELLFNVLGSVAQFERSMMLERQREGIAAAKAAGKYKGRVPTARRQGDEIRRLAAEGMSKAKIAETLGISERSAFRVLSASSADPAADDGGAM